MMNNINTSLIFGIITLSLVSAGCVIVYDDDYASGHTHNVERNYPSPDHYDSYEYLLIDASWSCSGNYWEFWAYTADDASYIYVDIVNLENPHRARTVSFHDYGGYPGYYWEEYEFYSNDDPQCGEAVDVIFYAYDHEGNWDQYLLYW